MPRRLLKHLFAILVVLIVAGCSGGGCGGCTGCGITPLPQGFPTEARIENAGSVRLTQSGIGFLQNNLGTLAQSLVGGMGSNGLITFPIDESSSEVDLFITTCTITVCKGGPDEGANPPKCVAEIDLGNADLTITPTGPHHIVISGPLPLRLRNLPIEGCATNNHITITGNAGCKDEPQNFAEINLNVPISIEIDANPAHSRHGYSKVVIGDIGIDEGALKNSVEICGGGIGGILNIGFIKDLVFDQFAGPLVGTLQGTLDEQLCQKANPELNPPCPDGSTNQGGTCKYADGECVSIMLGTDGNIDLSSFLSSISPGTKGGLDFLFAAGGESGSPPWGNLNPKDGGATLGMFGGALPKPQSTCVKLANMDPPQGIPIPDEITNNTVGGWPAGLPGPHVGIALNERFFNYALAGMYDSGLICIGIGGEQLNFGAISFNSDLFGTFLGAKSVKELGLQNESQSLALVVRPGAPPTAVFGNGTNLETDPLIRIGVKSLSIDFYVWSLDRFIRFMTYTVDVDLPLNLSSTPEGLVPVLEKINLNNATVTNNSLLEEDPAKIAASLTDLVGSQLGSLLGGALPAVNLNDSLASLGITLNIPETVEGQGSPGLRKLSKGSDNYLGIFASFGLAAVPPPPPVETKAEITSRTVDPAGLYVKTWTADNGPMVRIALSSPDDDGARAIEYQLRVNGGFWKPWTTKRSVDLSDGAFRIQGKHKVEVRSRVVGQPGTLDETPVVLDVTIDAIAPSIKVKETAPGKAEILVKDAVSEIETVLVRYRIDGGSWSEWLSASDLPVLDVEDADEVEVEAKDEEGLVGTAAQAIRGKAIPSADGGCGCTVAGGDSGGGKALGLLGLLVVGVALRLGRKGRGRAATAPKDATLVPAAEPVQATQASAPRSARASSKRTVRAVGLDGAASGPKPQRTFRALTAVAVMATGGLFAGCNCGDSDTVDTTGGTTTGTSSTTSAAACPECDTLYPGLAGAYSSAVVVSGTVWVAGYVEKSISEKGETFFWGDLAVGKYDGTTTAWELVDGVPEQEVDFTSFDVNGYRGGVTDPGDDVGLWTSIAANDAGTLGVAYYDRTHRSLKFALQGTDGWTVQTVQEKAASDLGRYAKLAWANGAWNIAFLAMEPGEAGAVSSGVRMATSANGSAWTFEDVYVNKTTPCAARFCVTDTACIKDTGLCTPELPKASCDPSCASNQACVDVAGASACRDKLTPAALETYPEGSGAYIAVAAEKGGSLGMVFYDRVKGNLMMASKATGAWVTAVLDGETNGVDTGDVGIGATLAIDSANLWHIAYSNGYDESLQYLQVNAGVPGTPEVIDDGSGIEGAAFDDGRHIVGDDASIHVSAGGDIQVSYQDATVGTLRYAVGTASANGHSWAVKVVEQDGFAGAFSKIIDQDGSIKVVNWSRKVGEKLVGDIAVVTP